METENKPEVILATQEDVDSFNSSLGKFSKTLGEKLKELEDQDGSELCLLKDEQRGLWIELHSKKISADVLMCHAQKGFEFLEKQRSPKGNGRPLGV